MTNICWAFDANVEPTVRRILVTASSDRGEGATLRSELGDSQPSDQGPEISVTQITDVIARYFEHESETASPFLINLSRKRSIALRDKSKKQRLDLSCNIMITSIHTLIYSDDA